MGPGFDPVCGTLGRHESMMYMAMKRSVTALGVALLLAIGGAAIASDDTLNHPTGTQGLLMIGRER